MSSLIVEVVEIEKVEKHPNADRLDLAYVKGWQSVVGKDEFKAGDKAVYIPVDSILPPELEAKLFPPDSKIKLEKSRVKTIKIRQALSQGMFLRLEKLGLDKKLKIGTDVKDELGIVKYEPPEDRMPRGLGGGNGKPNKKRKPNPNFKEYTDIERLKNYNKAFEEGEIVIISEKYHGCNQRAGYSQYYASKWWQKILQFLNLTPKYEFVYGSRKVQLQNKIRLGKGFFYSKNYYLEIVEKYKLKEILKPYEIVYGEIVGPRIQKGYHYGCGENERKLIIFDVMINGKYIDPMDAKEFCKERNLPYMNILYVGPFSWDLLDKYVAGPSVLCPEQKVREGIVIRPLHESMCYAGRKIFKDINPDYEMRKDNTEWK